MIDRSHCAAPRHGTAAAYAVKCRCADAREAWRVYNKRRREGRNPPGFVGVVGPARRVQALVALGWTWRALARASDWSIRNVQDIGTGRRSKVTTSTALRVRKLYDRLSGTPGGSAYALTVAARYGWVPPLAWEDIDDPDEVPNLGEPATAGAESIDHVRLDRALSGTRVTLTKAEQHHAVHRGIDQGMPLYLIAERLHMSYSAAKSYRRRPLPDGYELAA